MNFFDKRSGVYGERFRILTINPTGARMKLITDSALRRGFRGAFGRRSGFTLVELLTVIAIIGMLSAISITTVRASIQSAKETQTRTTIAKIDNVLTACYEKYQYRRVDLTGKLPSPVDNRKDNSPEIRARYRLQIIRDLLRCDFPCTPVELDTKSQYNGAPSSGFTPLQEALVAAAGGSLSSYDFEDENYPEDFGTATNHGGYPHVANAELLYLVVMNADPEARAAFSDREIGDVDRNGLYEFVDGWGKPICWMRWAPGLESSDRQPYENDMVDKLAADGYTDPSDSDPFDPMNVGVGDGSGGVIRGWFLVPYVFSAGPDEKYGLTMPNPRNVAEMNNPFTGASLDFGASYGRTHKDNIDNHTLVR